MRPLRLLFLVILAVVVFRVLSGCASATVGRRATVAERAAAAEACPLGAEVELRLGSVHAIRGAHLGHGAILTTGLLKDLRSYESVPITYIDASGRAVHATATLSLLDEQRGLAVYRTAAPVPCAAVIAAPRSVDDGDEVAVLAGAGYHVLLQVAHAHHPSGEPGNDNDVLVLSDTIEDLPAGIGLYSYGALIGQYFGFHPDGKPVRGGLAMPADRIMRFLEHHRIPYLRQ